MPNNNTEVLKKRVENLLQGTDILINGTRGWDIRVKDERFYARVIADGSLGFGEAYMDDWFECDQLDECLTKLLRHDVRSKLKPSLSLIADSLRARYTNMQTKKRAFQIGEQHYDVGNDLYQLMLDKTLTYTCGYWKDVDSLQAAQEAKLDLVCRKLGFKPGDRILDIGCGWGSFMKYAAEKYGVQCVGVTVSKEQVKLGQEFCKGLPIEFRLQDYRDVNEKFDHVISIGMFDHVGAKNHRTFYEVVDRCLKDDGLFLLHNMGVDETMVACEPWIAKYIFTNSTIPSMAQLGKAAEGLFHTEDWHVFHSSYYDLTLMAWLRNFVEHWPKLKHAYTERFYRMWTFYLCAFASMYRSRSIQLWHIVYSKKGIMGGYDYVR
jgi:cyclopropane-fatty-acyl-phospholipid synthase